MARKTGWGGRGRSAPRLLCSVAAIGLVLPGTAVAQQVESARSGDFVDPKTWAGEIVPNATVGGVVLHEVTVSSGAATRFVTVADVLQIVDGGALRLNATGGVSQGGKILINSDSVGALVLTPGSNQGTGIFTIGGCSNGEVEVARGGFEVNSSALLPTTGGRLRVGGIISPCANGARGNGRLLLSSPEAMVYAQNLGVGSSGFDGGTGASLASDGAISILGGTLTVGTSMGISTNGIVDLFGDRSELLTDRLTIEGALSVTAGADVRGFDNRSVLILREGSIEVDLPGSTLTMGRIEMAVASGAGGRLTMSAGAALTATQLSLSDGTLRFAGDATTGTFLGTGANDFAISGSGVIEIADGADVTVAGPAQMNGGRLRLASGGFLPLDLPLSPDTPISTMAIAGNFRVDQNATVSVVRGGQLSSTNGSVSTSGSEGHSYVELAGAASVWNVDQSLSIGTAGAGRATVALRDGARLTAAEIVLDNRDRVTTPRRLIIGRDAQNLMVGQPGFVDVAGSISFGANGELRFSHQSDDYRFDEVLRSNSTGLGLLVHDLGTTRLASDASQFSGLVQVTGGQLFVESILGASRVVVTGGAMGGDGEIVGAVRVEGGTLLARAGETLRMGPLTLLPAARIALQLGDYNLQAPAFVVNGGSSAGLVLDGTLDISAAAPLMRGTYRFIDFSGPLTDNGLQIGAVPEGMAVGDFSIVSQDGRVVLANGATPATPFYYWAGGDGTFSLGGAGFTTLSGDPLPLAGDSFLIFGGASGTVTASIAGGPLTIDGIQFESDGYTLLGGPLTIADPLTPFRIGDGTAAGTAMTATVSATIDGPGGIEKLDVGRLVLRGANSFSGGTTLRQGSLAIDGDGALGAMSGALTFDGGTLRLDRDWTSGRALVAGPAGGTIAMEGRAATFSGPISGGGALLVTGGGTLLFNGNGAGFSGQLQFQAGTFDLEGNVGGMLLIGEGGMLSGNGSFADLVVSGEVAPGNSIGVLNGTGGLRFAAGSVYDVEIAADGSGDRIAVAGSATLEGGTVRVRTIDPDVAYTDGRAYTILTAAGGLTGAFANLSETSAFLDFTIGYDARSAFVTVDVIRTFPDVAVTFNEIQAAGALAALDKMPNSDSLATYNAILMLDAGDARRVFNDASGEIYASFASYAAQRSALALPDGVAASAPDSGVSMWARLDGQWLERRSDGNAAATDGRDRGIEAGIAYQLSDRFSLGAGVGVFDGAFNIVGRPAAVDFDGWRLSGQLRYGGGGAGLGIDAGIAFSRYDARVSRGIAAPGIDRQAQGDARIDAIGGHAKVRYAVSLGPRLLAGPVSSIGFGRARLASLSETGAGPLALTVASSTMSSTHLGAGGFASWSATNLRAALSVMYVSDDISRGVVDAVLAGTPDRPFRSAAPRGTQAGVEVALQASLALGDRWGLGASASTRISGGAENTSAMLRLAGRF